MPKSSNYSIVLIIPFIFSFEINKVNPFHELKHNNLMNKQHKKHVST